MLATITWCHWRWFFCQRKKQRQQFVLCELVINSHGNSSQCHKTCNWVCADRPWCRACFLKNLSKRSDCACFIKCHLYPSLLACHHAAHLKFAATTSRAKSPTPASSHIMKVFAQWDYRKWQDRRYLQVMQTVLAQGKQVLILVPEIGLTPQNQAAICRTIWSPNIDAAFGLNDIIRLDGWQQCRLGYAQIIIRYAFVRVIPICQFRADYCRWIVWPILQTARLTALSRQWRGALSWVSA